MKCEELYVSQGTLDDVMKFLGIMFYMSLPKEGSYKNYWSEQPGETIFGQEICGGRIENAMSLRRFKHLRKVLTFQFIQADAPKSKDPLVRIQLLVNMLTSHAGRFIDVGRNISVDETSIACRSKYARDLIVFNATKPTGKYHFKLYVCCCSTSWIVVNFRAHCASSLADRLTGIVAKDVEARTEIALQHSSEVRKIVTEVTVPLTAPNVLSILTISTLHASFCFLFE